MYVSAIVWILATVSATIFVYGDARKRDIRSGVLWCVITLLFGLFGLFLYLIMTQPFKSLVFTTYSPLWILGVMVIFGVMGNVFNVGWLQSAPDVLMIPMLILYYISLVMGAIYGYMKQEESVYLMALIGIGIWIIGFLFGALLTLSKSVMIGINVFFLVAVLALHILQYSATKKWETRVLRTQRHTKHV